MPERLGALEALSAMSATGVLIGVGQLLASDDEITPRVIFGRAFSSVGLSLVAGVALIQIPHLPLIALVGLSALFASLGTSVLERIVQRHFGVRE